MHCSCWPRAIVTMNAALIDVLTQVVTAEHFDKSLYERVFRILGTETKASKLLNSIANTLEKYYKLHNRRSLVGGSRMGIPPKLRAKEKSSSSILRLCAQGISDFASLKELRSKVQQH